MRHNNKYIAILLVIALVLSPMQIFAEGIEKHTLTSKKETLNDIEFLGPKEESFESETDEGSTSDTDYDDKDDINTHPNVDEKDLDETNQSADNSSDSKDKADVDQEEEGRESENPDRNNIDSSDESEKNEEESLHEDDNQEEDLEDEINVLSLEILSDIWDGSAASGLAGGTGTSSDPYLISYPAQLAYLAEMVNGGTTYSGKYFKLTGDMVLNRTMNDPIEWVPIGNASRAFAGNFDGGDYSIRGLYIAADTNNQGLFGNATGTIKSVVIESGQVSGNNNIGGVAGSAGTVEDCINYAAVTGNSNVGGVAGRTTGSLKRNGNFGNVKGTSCAGGIAGYASSRLLEECFNEGDIEGTTDRAGGIAGMLYTSSSALTTVANCSNKGAVTGGSRAGGIAGGIDRASELLLLENSVNEGRVEGSQYVGGLVGFGGSSSEFKGNENHGSVSGVSYVGGAAGSLGTISGYTNTVRVEGESYIGGVAGSASSITDCRSLVEISGTNYVGGIAGTAAAVSDCVHSVSVTGTDYVGGIAGHAGNITRSINYLDIEGNNSVGGVAGSAGTVEDCANYAAVTGNSNVGGVAGRTSGSLKRNGNFGNVKGASNVGGVAGYASSRLLEECLNEGDIEGTTDRAGGIAGMLYTSSSALTTVTNCSNKGAVTGGSRAGGIAGGIDRASELLLVEDSINEGRIEGSQYVGGFVGFGGSNSTLQNVYSIGTVHSQSDLMGELTGTIASVIRSSYFLDDTGSSESPYARTSSQLKRQSTFEGWDFENVWGMEVDSYPVLKNLPVFDQKTPADMLLWPAKSSQVALWFGQNNLLDPAIHMGMNIQGEPGDDIYAVHDGTVVYTGYNPRYGHMLFINFTSDGKEMQARYGFLSAAPRLSVGANVQRGQTIGTMALHEDTGKGHMEIVLLESNDRNACEVSGINTVIVDPNIYMERPEISDMERFEYLGQPMAAVLDERGLSTFVTFSANAVSSDDEAYRYRMNLDLEVGEFDWGDEYDDFEESLDIQLYSEIGQYENIVKPYENYIRKLVWDKVKHQHKGSKQEDLGKLGYLSYDKSTDTCTVKLNGRTYKYGPSLGNAVYRNGQMVVNTEEFWNNHYRKTYTSSTGGTWTPKNPYFTKSRQRLVCEIYLPQNVATLLYTYSDEPEIIESIVGFIATTGLDAAVSHLATLGISIPAGATSITVGLILLIGDVVEKNEKASFRDAALGCGTNQFVKITVYEKTGRDLQKTESRSYSIAGSITDRYPQNGTFKAGVYEGLEILEQL